MIEKEPTIEDESNPLESILEASLVDAREGHETTHKLLEAALEQGDANDLSPLLEAGLVLAQRNKDEIVEAIKNIPEVKIPEQKEITIPKFPEFPTKMEMILPGVQIMTLKGEPGKEGRQGPKGDSIVGPEGPMGPMGPEGKTVIGPMGPEGPAGKNGSPDTGLDIVNKLQSLVGKDRLDKSAIKGLKEIEDSITRLASVMSTQDKKGDGTEWLMGGLHRVYTDSTLTGTGVDGDPLHVVGVGDFVPYTGADDDVDLGSFNLSVADEAYGSGWNGSLEVPTKNAIYDKIQTIASGGITRTITSISADATAGSVAAVDYVYFITGTTTLTLPTAVGNTNRYTIKSISGTTVVAAAGAETIDGTSTIGIANEDSVDLISNNVEWKVV